MEEKDFAERFKGLCGFISWFPSDPLDGCVFVELANEDDAKTAKLLLAGGALLMPQEHSKYAKWEIW